MGKVFGILMIVLGIYVGLELYTEGLQGAFGGIFAKTELVEPEQTEPVKRPTERIRDRVTGHMELGEARRQHMVDQLEP